MAVFQAELNLHGNHESCLDFHEAKGLANGYLANRLQTSEEIKILDLNPWPIDFSGKNMKKHAYQVHAFKNGSFQTLGSLTFDGPAQLLSRDSVTQRWLVLTFEGRRLRADMVRPLDQLEAVDFVLGPGSHRDTLAEGIAQKLIFDGYCVTLALDEQQDLQEMLSAAEGLEFARVPAEFEPYYLGLDSKEKHALIDEEQSQEVGMIKLLDLNWQEAEGKHRKYAKQI